MDKNAGKQLHFKRLPLVKPVAKAAMAVAATVAFGMVSPMVSGCASTVKTTGQVAVAAKRPPEEGKKEEPKGGEKPKEEKKAAPEGPEAPVIAENPYGETAQASAKETGWPKLDDCPF
jgi:hypothetical protein